MESESSLPYLQAGSLRLNPKPFTSLAAHSQLQSLSIFFEMDENFGGAC
jgi:hypothetical protein